MKNAKIGNKKSVSPATANIAPYSTKGPVQTSPYGMVGGYSNPALSPLSQPLSNPMMPAYSAMQPLGMPQSPCCGQPSHPGKAVAGAFAPNSGPGMMPAFPQVGGMQGQMGSMVPGTGTLPGPSLMAQGTSPTMAMQGTMPVGTIGGRTEESYIENILRLNLGKQVTIYMTFENSTDWNSKIFKGRLEAAGRDHIIISDPSTGKRYLLLMIYLDYITFDEPIEYAYPFHTGTTE